MKRSELEKAIQVATEIVQQNSVYIIGSQSILGSYDETELPDQATLSNEVDIAPVEDDPEETAATLLDGQAGEWSDFHGENGFYIQGVGKRTANLPQGWKARLVPVSPPGSPSSIGLCLEPHDLCAAKILAYREKDRSFVVALLEVGLVRAKEIRSRIDSLDPRGVSGDRIQAARQWAKWAMNEYPDATGSLRSAIGALDADTTRQADGRLREKDLGASTERGKFASRRQSAPESALD